MDNKRGLRILLVAGIALALFLLLWLGGNALTDLLDTLVANKPILDVIDRVISLLKYIFAILAALIFWVRTGKWKPASKDKEDLPLRQVDFPKLQAEFCFGQLETWVDRGVYKDLRSRKPRRKKVAILGQMKLGKTREAVEVVRCMIADGLFAPGRIFLPAPQFRLVDKATLRLSLTRSLDLHTPLLVFLDDLTFHFREGPLENLEVLFDVLRGCRDAYVVLTARSELLTPEQQKWLTRNKFEQLALPALSRGQSMELLDKAAKEMGIQLQKPDKTLMVRKSDGRPEMLLAALRRLKSLGSSLTHKDIAEVAGTSLEDLWNEDREEMEGNRQANKFLLQALDTFYASGITAHTELVTSLACHLWQASGAFLLPWVRTRELKRGLEDLQSLRVSSVGDRLDFPEILVEKRLPTADARTALERFLLSHRRLFQNPFLRWAYPAAEAHAWALFDLAGFLYEEQAYTRALPLYAASIRLKPQSYAYYNIACLHALQGEVAPACAWLRKAVALDPPLLEQASTDTDFDLIRSSPEFQELRF